MGKSWKTTVAGILAIIGAAAGLLTALLQGQTIDYTSVAGSFMAGIGLLAAKDVNVTGAGSTAKSH